MNKVILVTGSSSGFGKLIVQTLARRGHTVYASMRNLTGDNAVKAAELQKWASENRCDPKVIEMDVTSTSQIQKTLKEIFNKEGRINVLVNNAGHGSMGLTEDFTEDYVRMQFEANVFGVFNVTRAVIPVMKSAHDGLIVTISSGLGRMIIPMLHIYSASKFAVEALAEGWRYELAPVGIDSVIVEPGAFPTTNFMAAAYAHSPMPSDKIKDYHGLKEFTEGFAENLQERIKTGTAGDPQDVANAVDNLVAMANGSRPLRTLVDPMLEQSIGPLNRMTDEIEANMLHAMQLA